MESGRRTNWAGRPRPQHVSACEFSQTSRVTTLIVLPASMSASHLPISSKTPSSAPLTRSDVRDGLPRVRPGRTKGSPCTSPFLTGSAPQTEFPVTHSKQTTDEILTGARTHIKTFEILQISAQNNAAKSVVIPLTLTKEGSEAVSAGPPKSQTGLPGRRQVEPGRSNSRAWGRGREAAGILGPPKSTASRAWGRGREAAGISPFLTETAQHSEIVVTHSKQTTGEFLTETRIACRHHLNSAPRRSKFKPVRLRRASPVSQFAVTTSSLYPARPACFGGVSNCATTANPSLALISQARFLIQISGGKSHGNCSRTA
jgi:hypothetical protein